MVSTFEVGYIISLLASSKRVIEVINIGMRKKLIKENNSLEDGVTILPMKMDKYTWSLLGFLLIQYVILAIIA